MTKTKYLTVFAAVVAGSFFIAQTAFAHDDRSTVTENTPANKTMAEVIKSEKERVQTVKQQLEDRKKELQQQVQEKRAEVREKLTDKRKEICDKRQVNVNKILTNSNNQGKRNLQTFADIQAKVMQFAADKDLTVANYDALVADADAKKAAAEATMEVAEQTTFSCDEADASGPGKVVSDLMHTKHDALKGYRTAIKNLIVAIKQAAGDKTKTTGGNQ